ncbi:hypothetical protein FA15DRAFT_659406 [Coprinopsis marcescibilis]|uniref:Uncharacterized protein n=1 Tax=Coprinopsis marcescibilis TaxID=230819 RepID=A0A5C3KVR9_COPMA|nr:hypothetical protein FA15DRAFT_659406 [Coprinopsis marcescibilis]
MAKVTHANPHYAYTETTTALPTAQAQHIRACSPPCDSIALWPSSDVFVPTERSVVEALQYIRQVAPFVKIPATDTDVKATLGHYDISLRVTRDPGDSSFPFCRDTIGFGAYDTFDITLGAQDPQGPARVVSLVVHRSRSYMCRSLRDSEIKPVTSCDEYRHNREYIVIARASCHNEAWSTGKRTESDIQDGILQALICSVWSKASCVSAL